MKKKSTDEILQRRKLVLRREAIALLTQAELGQIAGGVVLEKPTWWWPCPDHQLVRG